MLEPPIPAPAEQIIPSIENLAKALLLIALLFGSFWIAQLAAERLAPWPLLMWGAILGLAVLNGVWILGMAVLAHEAVHRVLFKSPFWNECGGGLLAALALVPFHANRQFHLTHHSYAHQLGRDPENRMHEHAFWYAFTIGSLIGLVEQYRWFARNWLRLRERRYRRAVAADAFFVTFAALVYFALVPAMGLSLAYTVVPTLLVFPLVFAFRALSDHYGLPAVAVKTPEEERAWEAEERGEHRLVRDAVSGWVVRTHPLLEWLWSHVNYHEVHHKYPYLSHRYLKAAFAATRTRWPYRVLDGYWHALRVLSRRRYYDDSPLPRPPAGSASS
jgi:fatty acid desaturase